MLTCVADTVARKMLDRSEIAAFQTALMAEDHDAVARAFIARGNAAPVVRWSPRAEELDKPQLAFLRGFWDSHRNADGFIPRKEADPFLLRPALGFIMILEAIEDGWDYVYRLYGSGIAQYAVRDYTGLRTSELIVPGHTYIQSFYIAGYRAAAARGEPLYTENTPPPTIAVERWHRLVLPMADAAGRPTLFLVGNVPGSWRPPEAPAA
jgi:hypothetical protein